MEFIEKYNAIRVDLGDLGGMVKGRHILSPSYMPLLYAGTESFGEVVFTCARWSNIYNTVLATK